MIENAKIKKQCYSKRGRGDIQLIARSASVTLNFYPIFTQVSVRIFLQNCLKTANYRVSPKHANYILKVMKTNNMGNLNFVDFTLSAMNLSYSHSAKINNFNCSSPRINS